MTLTTRVSAFFLGWLGLSLAGFAVVVYLVARAELYRRADDRLQATLDAVVVAADVEPEGIEWEAHERAVPRDDGPNAVVWLIAVPDGPVVDRSNPSAGDWLRTDPADTITDPTGAPWRVAGRRLDVRTPQSRPPDIRVMGDGAKRVVKYAALDISAAVPLTPIRSDLRRLAGLLGALMAGLWLTAALIGRWLCRRTLAPVTEMAASARRLVPTDPGERLAVRTTGDELEDLGRAFNGVLDRLAEAFERQRRFTGDAAHQLRTPLTAMSGQVEVALRRDRDGPEYRQALQVLGTELGRLRGVTEALLFLARADAESQAPPREELDLRVWVAKRVEEWRKEHPAGERITFAMDGEFVGRVRTHPELLAQLSGNLLDNAAKYGASSSHITVRLRTDGHEVGMEIEDTGPGIDPADLSHVFEPYFRSPTARAAGVPGVGLGLAVAKRIADALGARLTAESQPGRGSRFTVWFPAEPA
ncbi:MAG TPA: ATP-binding protein [Gemmataceae bacterium]|nr:ATP-binding protein [Gemmataceae bacterium]